MADKFCELCGVKEGRYSCPSCGTFYCSVPCFRSQQHQQCSEDFYRKCVQEELHSRRCDTKPGNLTSILRSSNSLIDNHYGYEEGIDENIDHFKDEDNSNEEEGSDDDDDDDEGISDLANRIEDIDLDDSNEVWKKLTVRERREFRSLVSTGRIRSLLPEWQPWWKLCKPNTLVTEIELSHDDHHKQHPCPLPDLEIPPFTKLTKKAPAANVPYMLISVLMSYVYTARWFKGKHSEMPVEGVTTLFALSAVLRNNKIFQSVFEASEEFKNDLKNCEWSKEVDISVDLVWSDVTGIINAEKGSHSHACVKACLSDIHCLLNFAADELKSPEMLDVRRFTGPPPSKSKIKLISKKLIYYLSWIDVYGKQLTDALL